MSFLVRQISRTADGREIVRPRRFEQAETQHRPRRRVRHPPARSRGDAAPRGDPPDRRRRASRSSPPPACRSTSTAARPSAPRSTPQRGANIRIGAHVIAVSREADGRRDRRSPSSGSARSPMRPRPTTRSASSRSARRCRASGRWRGASSGWCCAAFLAWPMWSFYANSQARRHAQRAPIALPCRRDVDVRQAVSSAHAQLENNCKACHAQPFVAVRDTSCVACHDAVHDHADPQRLAAAMARAGRRRAACSSRSRARSTCPRGAASIAIPSMRARRAMPVTAQKFCTDCHAELKARLTDTKILDAGDFGTDHPQFRPAVRDQRGRRRSSSGYRSMPGRSRTTA